MSGIEQLIAQYGTLEAYNEEQRRCGLAQIEVQAYTASKKVKVDCANVVGQPETTAVNNSGTRRFSRIASWLIEALSANQPYPYTEFTILHHI